MLLRAESTRRAIVRACSAITASRCSVFGWLPRRQHARLASECRNRFCRRVSAVRSGANVCQDCRDNSNVRELIHQLDESSLTPKSLRIAERTLRQGQENRNPVTGMWPDVLLCEAFEAGNKGPEFQQARGIHPWLFTRKAGFTCKQLQGQRLRSVFDRDFFRRPSREESVEGPMPLPSPTGAGSIQ